MIFYTTEEQRQKAEESKQQLAASGRFSDPIVTTIEPAETFYLAEDEHQDYYKKNPENFERNHARRAAFIADNWEGNLPMRYQRLQPKLEKISSFQNIVRVMKKSLII